MLAACARGAAPTVTPGAVAVTPAVLDAATDSMPQHEHFTITSAALHETRRVNVFVPNGATTETRARPLPVLYMPDGGEDEDFPHIAHAVDSLIRRGVIRPVIVVGVPNTERRRDLTGPTRVKSDSAIAPRVGGSLAFRKFFREELIPVIGRRYRVTDERGIVGESLAGLFIVETFLEEPGLFTHYIALDASVWWNNGALIDSSAALVRRVDGRARTFYFASSKEPSTSTGLARLAGVLRDGAPGSLRWQYVPRADLEHGTIFRAVEIEALVSALR